MQNNAKRVIKNYTNSNFSIMFSYLDRILVIQYILHSFNRLYSKFRERCRYYESNSTRSGCISGLCGLIFNSRTNNFC